MVEKLLRSHASVRKYKDYTLSKEEVYELIETAQHAASSHFVQAYSVIWITDEVKKEELGRLSRNPQQFETAGAAFLLCADLVALLNKIASISEPSKEPPLRMTRPTPMPKTIPPNTVESNKSEVIASILCK